MILTIETHDEHALRALEEMAQRGEIRIQSDLISPESKHSKTEKKGLDFSALQLDTRGYKFNREEANER